MADLRILLVAPDKNAPPAVADEIQALINRDGLRVTLAHDAAELMVQISSGARWDVLWFAAHGTVDGVILPDEVINAGALVPYIRLARISLLVLNTCDSLRVAHATHQETGIDVLATIAPAADLDAYRTGVLFAGQLARGRTYREAYEQAKPGANRTFIYLEASPMAQDDRLDELLRLARDNRDRLIVVETKLQYVEEEVDKIRPRNEDVGPTQWAIIIVGILLAIIFLIAVWITTYGPVIPATSYRDLGLPGLFRDGGVLPGGHHNFGR